MLVLSRKETERIRLGTSIVVTVVRVSGDKVRLGIEAPPDVLVLRDELQPHERPQSVKNQRTAELVAVQQTVVPAQSLAIAVVPSNSRVAIAEGSLIEISSQQSESGVVTEFEVELTSGLTVEVPA